MQIAGREISDAQSPFVIAEVSGNHGHWLKNAFKLIEEAKKAGADAVKTQCFQAGRLTLNSDKPDFTVKGGPWNGRRLYDLYAKTETPRAWFHELFAHAQSCGITLLSSVFSEEDVDFLEELGCPAYKIASMEITDVNLIAYAAKTGKPIIISTGMASNEDKDLAWNACQEAKFLHCISGYPTPVEEANLSLLNDCDGISDHTTGWTVPVAATALGAQIIEKHLKLYGVETEDSAFSLNPAAFLAMVTSVRAAWHACRPSKARSEESSRQLRRSLYVVKDIKANEAFTKENVRSIRPAHGLHPKELPMVLGCWAAVDIKAGTALEMGMVLPF